MAKTSRQLIDDNHVGCSATLPEEGHVLKVTYLSCRHVATVSPAPLLVRFGEHQRLVAIEERFACTECGNRGAVCRLTRNT